ncbi:hypothetical protein EBZ39_09230 [bacterium]|nr:hypothetical protein [bacterium]
MSQAGYTPIQLYYSTTASAAPSSGNLANGELAINITDGKLYYKDNSGVVQIIATKSGATGTVSSVAQTFTGGIISVSGSPITTSGTLALTVAGTSGGIPYFSSSSAWASSAALAANAIVVGGGAGAAPATITTGTGVVTALGVNTGSSGAFVVNGGALGTPSSGTLSSCTVDGTNKVGFLAIPQSGSAKTTSYTLATTDVGEFIQVGSGGAIVIPNSTFSAGDVVSVFNNTSGSITITCNTSTTYIAGTDSSKASVSLATRGVATMLFISSTLCVITGNVS